MKLKYMDGYEPDKTDYETRSEQRATANLISAADELRKEHPELSVVCDALADAIISITTKKEACIRQEEQQ